MVKPIAFVVDKRATTSGEIVLLDHGDTQTGLGETSSESNTAGTSA